MLCIASRKHLGGLRGTPLVIVEGNFVYHLLPLAHHRTARRPHGPVRPVCGVAVMKRSVVVATPRTGHEFLLNNYARVAVG